MDLPLLDWVLLAVLVVSLLLGAWRGLVYEMLTCAGWVAAFFLAQWWASDLAVRLPLGSASAALRHAVAFVAIFILGVFAS
ncbi:MAG: CvpA family protein, partial [Pseudomonadota bacterium]